MWKVRTENKYTWLIINSTNQNKTNINICVVRYWYSAIKFIDRAYVDQGEYSSVEK